VLRRAISYLRYYRNWWELARIRSRGLAPHRVVLRNGLLFDSPVDTNVARLVKAVHFKRYFNPPGFEIREGDVAVDVGANVGAWSVYAARRTRGRVIAIEPFASNVEYLARNCAANGCANVEIVEAALGDKDGPVELYVSEKGVAHQLFRETNVGTLERSVQVTGVSLPRLMEQRGIERIDFLKLNCEGAEGLILGSLPPALFERIDRIALQFHDYASPLDHAELQALLERAGFETRLRWDGKSRQGFLYARSRAAASGRVAKNMP
jgi:FkbM family methyltransferase